MPTTAGELAERVEATANRLRSAQVGFADDSPDRRMEYLRDIIDQAASSVLPDQRQGFLEALNERFPCCQAPPPVAAAPAPAPVVAQAPVGVEEDDDVDDLAERLAEALEGCDDETRRRILSKFEGIGLISDDAPGHDAPAATGVDGMVLSDRARQAYQYLMRRLGIQSLDVTRSVKLLVLMLEYLRGADQLTWNTWRTIAPRSELRRPCDLRKEAALYISGDRDVSGSKVREHVESLRKLAAALTAGVGQAGSQFARKHLLKFTPEEIEARAHQGGGLLTNKEYKCWNLYVGMARDLGEDAIEHAIKEAIVGYTETLMEKSAQQKEQTGTSSGANGA